MARHRRQLRIQIPVIALCAVAVIWAAYFLWPAPHRERAARRCDPGPTVAGIDVSYYQQDITWKRVRRAGIRFAFIRASDGLGGPDTKFARNWREAKRAKILRGAYQYFRPDQDPTSQADLLINMLAKDRGELPPVLDIETTGGKPPAELVARARVWIARVRDKLGVEPIVYTGPEFWRDQARGGDLATQPLWLAHYTRGCPAVPAPWTSWQFWQHTDRGRVPGIEGPVDLDVFAGTFADLEELARRAVVKAAAR